MVGEMMKLYYKAKKQFTSPLQFSTKEVQSSSATVTGVLIQCDVWVDHNPRFGFEEIRCRLKTHPTVALDNTHYLHDFALNSLLTFTDMTVKSDRDGLYFCW